MVSVPSICPTVPLQLSSREDRKTLTVASNYSVLVQSLACKHVPSIPFRLWVEPPGCVPGGFSRFIEEDPIQTGILQSNSAVKFCIALLSLFCCFGVESPLQFLYITSNFSISKDQRIHCMFQKHSESWQKTRQDKTTIVWKGLLEFLPKWSGMDLANIFTSHGLSKFGRIGSRRFTRNLSRLCWASPTQYGLGSWKRVEGRHDKTLVEKCPKGPKTNDFKCQDSFSTSQRMSYFFRMYSIYTFHW